MAHVIDTDGIEYSVDKVSTHYEPSGPYTTIVIGGFRSSHTLPESIARRWLNNEIRVKIPKSQPLNTYEYK